jgi:hypothetical protein
MIAPKRAVAALSLALSLLAACRSEPDPAARPSPSLASADPRDAFVPLDGFRYRKVPERLRQQMEEQLTADPQARQVLEGFEARFAVARKTRAVLVFGMAVDPEAAANPFFTEGLFVGFERGLGGGSLSKEEISGQQVRVGSAPQLGAAILWQQGALVIGVMGQDEAATRAVATQLVEGIGSSS